MTKKYFHLFDKSIIREYDIRGVVGESLFAQDAYYIGKAFATKVKREYNNNLVTVGYDARISSTSLVQFLTKGLIDCGMKVINIGVCPTPMLYYSTYRLDAIAGLMVTGSHNPPEYNGIKFMLDHGPFFGEDLKEIARMMNEGDFEESSGEEIIDPKLNVFGDYIELLRSALHTNQKFRIAWDPGNGAASHILEKLLPELPGKHFLINGTLDGTFPNHHPDPTLPENLEQLKAEVKANNCDFGIAFDGDGDRIGVVDNQGNIIWGEQLLRIFVRELVKEHPNPIVLADVKTSNSFFEEAKSLGASPVMWKTGHALIKSKMTELGALLAGEMSGHLFFSDHYYGFDDALYASIRLIDAVANADQSLNEIYASFPKTFATPEIRIDCADDRKFDVIDEIRARICADKSNEVSTIDGIRVSNGLDWWLLRASNTQPCLVARCEAMTLEGFNTLKAIVINQLKISGIEVKF